MAPAAVGCKRWVAGYSLLHYAAHLRQHGASIRHQLKRIDGHRPVHAGFAQADRRCIGDDERGTTGETSLACNGGRKLYGDARRIDAENGSAAFSRHEETRASLPTGNVGKAPAFGHAQFVGQRMQLPRCDETERTCALGVVLSINVSPESRESVALRNPRKYLIETSTVLFIGVSVQGWVSSEILFVRLTSAFTSGRSRTPAAVWCNAC